MNENNANNSLTHTKWNCKYHIVFAPKYRRKVFFEEKRLEIREILRQLCKWKNVEIVEGEVCPETHTPTAERTTNALCIQLNPFVMLTLALRLNDFM